MTGLWDSRTLDWVGPPLTYVMSVAALVCLYHAAADVSYCEGIGLHGEDGGSAGPAGVDALHAACLLPLLALLPLPAAAAAACASGGCSPFLEVPTSIVAHLPALLQAGYVAEVIPELKPAATAPFSLTSFALSTLLVLR